MKRPLLFLFLLVAAAAADLGGSSLEGKKILYIDSYHEGYPWSSRIQNSIRSIIEDTGVVLDVFYMNTKLKNDEESKSAAGVAARDKILTWEPDIVIASDDNASKYVIAPYFRGSDIDFIFCGINWNLSRFDFTDIRITGMVEVHFVLEMLEQMAQFTEVENPRIGYLASDTYTEVVDADLYKNILKISFAEEVYVRSYREWKREFLRLQEDVDMLIIGTQALEDFDYEDAESFVLEHTRIPTGAQNEFLMPLALIGYIKVPEEFGIWSTQSALRILEGTDIHQIAIEFNERFELYLNMKIADKLGIIFQTGLLKNAHLIRSMP